MRNTLKLITAASVIFACSPSNAMLSSNFDKCMEQSGGVTVDMIDCMSTEYEMQDKLLNNYYNQIMSTLNNDAKKAFKKSQIAWLKWKEAEVDAVAKIYEDNINYNSVNLQIISDRVDKFAQMLGIDQTENYTNNNTNSVLGTYVLKEDGRGGSLTLSEEGPDYGIHIESATDMGDTCDYYGLCTVEGSQLNCEDPAPDTEQPTVFVKLANGKVVVETESSSYSCGLRNYLNGTYYKK